VIRGTDASRVNRAGAAVRRVFWSAVVLAVALAGLKAIHLGRPHDGVLHYLRSVAAISYSDAFLTAIAWAFARFALFVVRRRPRLMAAISYMFVAASALCCVYALVNVLLFGIVGGFLTYPLLAIVGDVRMVRSSVSAHLTTPVLAGLVLVPTAYLILTIGVSRLARSIDGRRMRLAVSALLTAWIGAGHWTYITEFDTRADRRIAESPMWAMGASTALALTDRGFVRMADGFAPDDLNDFEPPAAKRSPAALLTSRVLRRATNAVDARAIAARRPPNVILVVLESVAARWTSLHNPLYETTPTLEAESVRSAVVDKFYAHIGRSSNSMVAMLMSKYPKLDFRELTEQYPDYPGTSLAAAFKDRGYRTSFVTPSDLQWAGWRDFLARHAFDDVWDHHDLACTELLSSWGVEDRCMIDKMVDVVASAGNRPFFMTAWTTQTHHPYETTPGVPELDLVREHGPDDWELGKYLNVVHETDRQLARLFEAVRRAKLEQDTLIVVTGDHGQAFGYPHATYTQGRTVYEEDVHVPLMLWYPRVYRTLARPRTIGSHVDLAPTIAELAGLAASPDWQGRSLFDDRRPERAYFYVAEDHFRLAVRDGNWKYIYSVRDGRDELYDLESDPTEQRNVAADHPDRCDRLRQRLAAWTEANRKQYERVDTSRVRE
jgi:arylsulfatase A-like enzyme